MLQLCGPPARGPSLFSEHKGRNGWRWDRLGRHEDLLRREAGTGLRFHKRPAQLAQSMSARPARCMLELLLAGERWQLRSTGARSEAFQS